MGKNSAKTKRHKPDTEHFLALAPRGIELLIEVDGWDGFGGSHKKQRECPEITCSFVVVMKWNKTIVRRR